MRNTINIATLARVQGRPLPVVHQLFHSPAMKDVGERQGRERALDLGDFTLVRLVDAFRDPGRTVEQALEAARAVADQVVKIGTGAADEPRLTHVIILDDPRPDFSTVRRLAPGQAAALRFVKAGLDVGYTRFTILDLEELVEEIFAGWHYATGRGEEFEANLRAGTTESGDDERLHVEHLIATFRARLAPPPQIASKARVTGNGTLVLDCEAAPAKPAAELRVEAEPIARVKARP